MGRRRGSIATPAVAAVFLAGCTAWNATDACAVAPEETRVNAGADNLEFFASPRAAAVVRDGGIFVAYVSAVSEGDTYSAVEVRLTVLDPRTGTRRALCDGNAEEIVLSDPEVRASGASVVAVDWADRPGRDPVALVGWSETTASGERHVRVRPIDSSGCPLPLQGAPYAPVVDERTGEVDGLRLLWSDTRRAVLASFQDGRRILGAWLETDTPVSDAEVLAQETVVLGQVASAIDGEGRVAIAWRYWDQRMLGSDEQGIRALLLDSDGAPRPAAMADGAAPFRVNEAGDYYVYGSRTPFGVSVATEGTRIAFGWDGGDDPKIASRARIREIDAADGVPLAFEGAPDGGPALLDPANAGGNGSPSVAYLTDGSLLALWESVADRGTVGRLFGPDGAVRFSGVGCDERPFPVGERADTLPGTSTALLVGDRLWVFHSGDPPDDPSATAALGWRVPEADLWPGGR